MSTGLGWLPAPAPERRKRNSREMPAGVQHPFTHQGCGGKPTTPPRTPNALRTQMEASVQDRSLSAEQVPQTALIPP